MNFRSKNSHVMSFTTLVGLILLLISLVYFWIRKKYSFFEDNGVLHEKPSFPLGNLKGAGTDVHIADKVRENYEKFKARAPLYGMYFFINPNFIITDLELIKNVLVKDFSAFHNRGLYSNVDDDPLTGEPIRINVIIWAFLTDNFLGHLLLLEDEAWRNMRTKMTPTFTSGKMKMMFETVLKIADSMVTQLKTEPNLEMIEIKNVLGNFTTVNYSNFQIEVLKKFMNYCLGCHRKCGVRS